MTNKVVDFINLHRDRYVDELKEYLAIPSISALPQHAADVRRCAEWTSNELTKVGLQNVRLIETPGNPGGLRRVAGRRGRADDSLLRPLRRAAGGSARQMDSAAVRGDGARRRDLRARIGRRQGPDLHALQGRRSLAEGSRHAAGEHQGVHRGRRGGRFDAPRHLRAARTTTCSRPMSSSSRIRRCSIAASRRSATGCADWPTSRSI